jgi:hypothetical protein
LPWLQRSDQLSLEENLMRRLLSFLLAAAMLSLVGASVKAVTTTKNVDILVTHSGGTGPANLTSFTVKNNGATTVPAGTTVMFGQGFPRGAVQGYPASNCIRIGNASGGTLVNQVDEEATRHYNGDDGSLLHVSWAAQTDSPIGAGGTYTFNFYATGSACPAKQAKQTLAGLASAHDLKIRFTDVRNQDDSFRRSGSMTFSVNNAALNTGRDAPRKFRTGPAVDGWIIRGAPVDAASGLKDPMIYVTCYIEVTTATDGASIGPVRHICGVDNPWENVAAGTAGNAGSPGPAGLPLDPQALSYRAQYFDGSTSLIDWSILDQSVAASSNPVVDTGGLSGSCSACFNIPAQGGFGQNEWYQGQAVRFTTTGTPPQGMTNGGLYHIHPYGITINNPSLVQLLAAPYIASISAVDVRSQGSGTHTFSARVWHPKWMRWYTTDQLAKENWTNGTARVTSPLDPAWTTAERNYFEQSGTIPPIEGNQTVDAGGLIDRGWRTSYNYNPMSRSSIKSTAGVGDRPDIGLINEWASQAIVAQTSQSWDRMRLFAFASAGHPLSFVLNEATGYLPPVNNGPPGANHGGSGASYPVLGAPQPNNYIYANDIINGIAPPLNDRPVNYNNVNGVSYFNGFWGDIGARNDHMPSMANAAYAILGTRQLLDALYHLGNRAALYRTSLNQENGRDFAVPGGAHFYGLHYNCCENRGAAWASRDKEWAAYLGADSNPERDYNHDMLVENAYVFDAIAAWKDGSDPNHGYSQGFFIPGGGTEDDTFIDNFWSMTAYSGWAMARDPFSKRFLDRIFRLYMATCDGNAAEGGSIPNALSAFYCSTYSYGPAKIPISDAEFLGHGDIGFHWNSIDARDMGVVSGYPTFTASSATISMTTRFWLIRDGDEVHVLDTVTSVWAQAADQLNGTTWYRLRNVDMHNPAGVPTFEIENPNAPGTSISSWTSLGAPLNGPVRLKYRPTTPLPLSTQMSAYSRDGGTILRGLRSLGYNTNHALGIQESRGIDGYYDGLNTRYNWSKTLKVP